MRLDVPRRHAAAIQRQDLVVEPLKAALALADDLRLEADRPFAIVRIDLEGAQHRRPIRRRRHQPPPIRAAIAVVAAIADQDPAAIQREPYTLELINRSPPARERRVNHDRGPRHRLSRNQIQREQVVVNDARDRDRADRVDATCRRIDNRRTRDTDRGINITARRHR